MSSAVGSAIAGATWGANLSFGTAARTHFVADAAEVAAIDADAKQQLARLLDEWRQLRETTEADVTVRASEIDDEIVEAAARVVLIAAARADEQQAA